MKLWCALAGSQTILCEEDGVIEIYRLVKQSLPDRSRLSRDIRYGPRSKVSHGTLNVIWLIGAARLGRKTRVMSEATVGEMAGLLVRRGHASTASDRWFGVDLRRPQRAEAHFAQTS
jgi:hypothetical protein